MAWTQPKTWTAEPLIAGDMNTHLRDNLEALKDPPSAHYEVNESADYSTTSTSFTAVDGTNLVKSITTNGGDVMAYFHCMIAFPSASYIHLNVEVDGALFMADDGIIGGQSGAQSALNFTVLITGLDPGSHTFKLMWKVNAGTGTMNAGAGTANRDNHPQFWVREVS